MFERKSKEMKEPVEGITYKRITSNCWDWQGIDLDQDWVSIDF